MSIKVPKNIQKKERKKKEDKKPTIFAFFSAFCNCAFSS